jgi:hypothetical protein
MAMMCRGTHAAFDELVRCDFTDGGVAALSFFLHEEFPVDPEEGDGMEITCLLEHHQRSAQPPKKVNQPTTCLL